MLTATSRRWRPGFWALLLSLLLAAHMSCAAGAIYATEAAETTAVGASAPAETDTPHSDGTADHHPCQEDSRASADQRTSAVAAAVLSGLGAGTPLPPHAAHPPEGPWQSPADALSWSGTRLLVSLCVQQI